jgi:hypothetical protein
MTDRTPENEQEARRLRHDMMNQIHILVGNLSLLEDEVEGEAAQMLADATKAATALQNLTKELFTELGIVRPPS